MKVPCGADAPFSADGNDGSHFRDGRLGLVADQFAQERNQHDERNADREAANAKLGEELCVPGVDGDRRGRQPARKNAIAVIVLLYVNHV